MADVTVMGAGIFGLSVAWACAKRGAQVQVIDPAGVGAGSSGGVVGALAPHTAERWELKKEFQLNSLLMAGVFWEEVDKASGINSGYGRTGRLQPIANEHVLGLARERIGQADELWRGAAQWQVREAAEFSDWGPPSPTGFVVYDTLSARMDPRRAGASLAGALAARGVPVLAQGNPVGKVVWATGWRGLAELSAALGRDMGNGVKGQSILVAHDAGPKRPHIFVNGLYLVAHDNGTVAIGSTSERYFDDPQGTDAQLDAIYQRALKLMPQLGGAEVISRWAGVRPRAITRAPLLGAWPGRAGHFIANGGFKIGFGMAPKVAEVMADLVLEGVNNVPEEFSISFAMQI